MSSEWIETTLGEVLTLQRGIDLPVQDRRVGSVPVVASTGIVGFHNEAPVKGPGVVIGRSGSIGGGQFIRQDFWPLNTTLWVKDFHDNDPRYCYYLLRSMDFSGLNAGSGVPTLNRNHLHPLKVWRPPTDQQRAIANILGGLDDKIDLNRHINQTLEAVAQAIFKSWFVDFDPVKAKIAAIVEGRDPLRAAMSAISGKPDAELDALPPEQYAQLAATAALFPDEMEDAAQGSANAAGAGSARAASELGEIPKGWSAQRVGNMLELVYGKALKSTDRQEGTVPVYGSGGITGYHNTPLVPHGSIVVGRKGTVGSLYWEDEPFFPIDTTYYVRPLAAPLTYCYYAMQTLGLEKMNTDAAVPGLNRENVYRLELVRPDSSVLQKFDSKVSTLRKTIRTNSDSNKALAKLRDTLLPKLLSGELSVAQTIAEVEA